MAFQEHPASCVGQRHGNRATVLESEHERRTNQIGNGLVPGDEVLVCNMEHNAIMVPPTSPACATASR